MVHWFAPLGHSPEEFERYAADYVGKKVDTGPTVDTCQNCQAGVTAGQQKISQLFAGKTLCKKCLDETQGVKA
ncbi:MAG: hypothetical protein QMD46_12420 [Methanomicrobiales archaeon]|nr:hypothetical protein [Methanomicrobiales archaeon]